MRRGAITEAERGLEALRELYAAVDAAHEGVSCDASTDCCHFDRTGRQPWVTGVEWELMVRAAGRLGGLDAVRARHRRALPVLGSDSDGGRCPFLDPLGRCSIYAARPLGCRTFLCDRAHFGARVPKAPVRDALRALQGIAERHSPASPAGRPLKHWLAAARR